MGIGDIVKNQKKLFLSGKTLDYSFRKNALIKLRDAISSNEEAISDALKKDLNKSLEESYLTEISIVYDEIHTALKNLKKWIKPEVVSTPFSQFSGKSFIVSEPLGTVLILSPWNYPINLALAPVVGAIAAGNCVVLKASKSTPNVSNALRKMVEKNFDKDFFYVVDVETQSYDEILSCKYDYIFFTGSENIGKVIMAKAAENLTPVTLELGGKSPCIIEKSANLKLSAKRLAWGKWLNSGQTCVAPDYVLIDKSIKNKFLAELKNSIKELFTANPLTNEKYPRIINKHHFERLLKLTEGEDIYFGGKGDLGTLRIEPTILNNCSFKSKIMEDEIFGPILPIIEYENLDQTIATLKNLKKPLALYLFTTDKNVENKILKLLSYGGGCINDVIIHLASSKLPFGGVGSSGMGKYHGKYSFDTFSNKKSVVKKDLWIDLPLRYPPYNLKNLNLAKLFLKK